ncbi:glycosyltransferase [Enterococcus sp. MJM12]|uniref:Glycosyltransferase n=1 Tax=Candidatus Enterococcus myersii TaxID=2815322 RepID=A0ABS3H5D0_9ENTE|nr:glycosyltransferase [Enterococcus sp. MJM12]MBO0448184.1 glycosyltransferase [Enterococcus sp. MJM12]
MKKVSIIMGVYNCESTIAKSIESILNQTFTDYELIIWDDGSTDSTLKIAKEYEKNYQDKVKCYFSEENKGLNKTLNLCIKVSEGEFIARQDADDYSEKSRLEKQVMFLDENDEISIVGSNFVFFDGKKNVGEIIYPEYPSEHDLLRQTPFAHPTVLVRKKDLISVGGYSEGECYYRIEDYQLWFKMFSKGYKGYNIQENLYYYREDSESFQRRNFLNRKNEMRLKWEIFKHYDFKLYESFQILKPIVIYLIPKKVYIALRKRKYG